MTLHVTYFCLFLALAVSGNALDVHRRSADRPGDNGNTPVDPGRSLHDALADAIDQTYTDFVIGLTSIKDAKRNACFLFDLDPNLELGDEDKEHIMRKTGEPKTLDNEKDFIEFIRRAGPNIGNMCRTSRIYWLASTQLVIDDIKLTRTYSVLEPSTTEMIEPPKLYEAHIPRSRMNSPPRPRPARRNPPPPPTRGARVPPPHPRHNTDNDNSNNSNNNGRSNNNNNRSRTGSAAAPPSVSQYRARHAGNAPPPPPPPSSRGRHQGPPNRPRQVRIPPPPPQSHSHRRG